MWENNSQYEEWGLLLIDKRNVEHGETKWYAIGGTV